MEKETALKEAYAKLLAVGFGEGSIEETSQFITKDVMGYGTALDEKIMTLEDFNKLIEEQRKQAVNFDDFSFTSNPVKIQFVDNGNVALVVDEIELNTQIKNNSNTLFIRMTTVFEFRDESWRVIHWHGSKPEHISGGEDPWHVDEWKKKNAELEKAVEEKTADLMIKNHELEIEGALEKVRSSALVMKEPADMVEVCNVISDQLQLLGVKDIRNVQTAIINEQKGTYLNYQYFAAYQKEVIEETDYNKHPTSLAMVQEMIKSANSTFSGSMEGRELNNFREWRKQNHQFPDPILDKLDTAYYYFYSIGLGGLGLTTYKPLPKEELEIFKRFHNVFTLAYSRFVDIEKAIAQAREAKIEAALERVRSISMAMQKSDELGNTSSLMFKEIVELGVNLWSCGFNIIDHEKKIITQWVSSGDGRILPPFETPATDDIFVRFYEGSKSDKSLYIEEMGGKHLVDHYKYMTSLPQVQDIVNELDSAGIELPKFQVMHAAYFQQGYLLFITYKAVPDFHIIFERFAKVFEQTYTRFLDLQKAEAQARESQIQLALERVRARAMAMQKPDELIEVAELLRSEMGLMGVEELETSSIYIHNNEETTTECWYAIKDVRGENRRLISDNMTINIQETWVGREMNNFYNSAQKQVSIIMHGENRKEWINYCSTKSTILDGYYGDEIPDRTYHLVKFSNGFLGAASPGKISIESWDLLYRATTVFSLAYTRFLDLQKAEAQARESQIQLALERVRSRSIGMQKSDELNEVIQVVYEQFVQLNINIEHTGFIMDYKARDDMHIWLADSNEVPSEITIPYFDSPHWNSFNEAKEKGKDFFVNHLTFEEKNNFYQDLFKLIPGVQKETMEYYFNCPGLAISTVLLENVGLYIENFSGIPYSDEENKILMRFGKVFQQTYTRFLDLQKAEAQAREAQVEAALERVRSLALGMRKSEEVGNVTDRLFTELINLSVDVNGGSIVVIDEDIDKMELWRARSNIAVKPFESISFTESMNLLKRNMPDWFPTFFEALLKRKNYLIDELSADKRSQFINVIAEQYKYSDTEKFQLLKNTPEKITTYYIFFKLGYLALLGEKKLTDENLSIARRFVEVFEFSYTRFSDITKAEEQAREAQIDASLEKVRAHTMGMQTSEDLSNVASVMFDQMKNLGGELFAFGIVLCDKHKDMVEQWHNLGNEGMISPFSVPVNLDYIHQYRYDQWRAGEELFSIEIPKDYIARHFELMFELPSVKTAMDEVAAQGIEVEIPYWEIDYGASFKHGYLLVSSRKPFKEDHIFLRFAKVFEQAYTRFLDLKKAEAQAREAQIETALEKVRSRTMAMQKGEELKEVVVLLYKELIALGVNNFVTCGYVEINEKINRQFTWVTNPGGDSLGLFYLPLTGDETFDERYSAWKQQQIIFHQKVAGEVRRKHLEYAITTFNSKEAEEMVLGQFPDPCVFYCFNFSHGYLHLVTGSKLTKEEELLLARFTRVFEQTYARFLDLQKAEAQSREAQIEAGLERARAQSMMMQHSEELNKTSQVFHEQLRILGIDSEFSYLWLPNEVKNEHLFWATWQEGADGFKNKQVIYPLDKSEPAIAECYLAWESDLQVHVNPVPATGVEEYFNTWSELLERVDKFKPELYPEGLYYVDAYMKYGCFGIMIRKQLSEDELQVLHRFSREFERAYTRFLDLKKAEAQAREAQIELSLERIRAKVTAMKESSELLDIVVTMRSEFVSLGYEAHYFWHMRWLSDKYEKAMTSGDGTRIGMVMSLPRHIHGDIAPVAEWEKSDQPTYVLAMDVDTAVEYVDKMITLGDFELVDPQAPSLDDIRHIGGLTFIMARTTHGEIGFSLPGSVPNPPKDTVDTLVRFAGVFDLAYKRFEDLKSAEHRHREAEIELALERVRSRSMAMHESDELADLSLELVKQVHSLGVDTWFCAFNIYDDDPKGSFEWGSNGQGTFPQYRTPREGIFLEYFEAAKRGEVFLIKEIGEKECPAHYEYLCSLPGVGEQLLKMKEAGIPFPKSQIDHVAYFKYGYIIFITFEHVPKAHDIFKRFARVFEQTYTRFLDLQRAEEQARKSKIEAALERVRARTMAMQKSNELAQTAAHLFTQLNNLGIKPYRCNIAIIDEEKNTCQLWSTTKSGNVIPTSSTLSLIEYSVLQNMYDGWKTQRPNHVIKLIGKPRLEWAKYISKYLSFEEYKQNKIDESILLEEPAYLSNLYFKQGFFTIYTREELTADELMILQRFAHVFEQTYTRYLDLENVERQNKIIQTENQRKTQELEEARELQLAMLPIDLPNLPNFDIAVYMQTATEVGGDYYDFNVEDDGTLTAVIGDATGHGMKAGTIVTITKSLFNSLASEKNILEIFHKISKVIKDMKFRQLSMCLMLVKIEDNILTVSSAAMPPALIYRKSKNTVDEFELRGMPLGAIKNFPYKTVETKLHPGDTILLMSDGLPELLNDKKYMYGYDRIKTEFGSIGDKKSEEIIKHLKDVASKWNNGKDPDDDVTFVVIKMK